MLFKLFLAFTLIPVAEIYLFIKIGGSIGAFKTVIMVILTAFAGAYLAKMQGLQTMLRVRTSLEQGILPQEELVDALLIFIAGIVLLTPGFLTDAFGLLLLYPTTRFWFKRYLRQRFDQWISQLCLAFSWRLIYLAAKNDHLVWSLQMHPHNSPADMVLRVRQTTSQRIFQEFPHLKINELAEDFWAPGYLVITGSQLPTSPTVQSYLRRVRSWQGTTGDLD